SLAEKEHHQFKEKQRIAQAAVKMIKEGQCVILDSGSTTTAIARELRTFTNLTVVTNAVNIAGELASTSLDVDGFDPAIGVTTPNVLESRVNRLMVQAAQKVVAVCDSTKFRSRSLALI